MAYQRWEGSYAVVAVVAVVAIVAVVAGYQDLSFSWYLHSLSW
jgi:hypothetical protein